MREALDKSDEIRKVNDETWQWLCQRTFYAGGDFSTGRGVRAHRSATRRRSRRDLRSRSATGCSTSRFRRACSRRRSSISRAQRSRLANTHRTSERPWARVVIEKPFGREPRDRRARSTALVLDQFGEHQIYRIDHYLGKESVQNILVFRFANPIFEPLWNRQYITHVQITAAETVGIEGAREVLRGSGRHARHVPESSAAAADARRDGAADLRSPATPSATRR